MTRVLQVLPAFIWLLLSLFSSAASADTFQYSGFLESDSLRTADLNLSVNGTQVTGKLTLNPVCQSNARLPGAEFNLSGNLSGEWEGKGSISGTWTGSVRWCEKSEDRSGSFSISLGQGKVVFGAIGSYYNRYLFTPLGKVSAQSATSGEAAPSASATRPTVSWGQAPQSALGPPGPGFQPNVPSHLRQNIMETVEMGLSEVRLFSLPLGGNWFRTEDMKRIEGFKDCYDAGYYADPGDILSVMAKVGDGINVKAVGEGIGRVYGSKGCSCLYEGGGQGRCTVAGVWIVVVGEKGFQEYTGKKRDQGQTAGSGPAPDIARAVIKGRTVMVGTKKPVGNVAISLVARQGGVYSRDGWKSKPDGAFSIRAENMLLSGVYEVMAQWHSPDMGTADDPFTVYKDLWPIKKYFITFTKDRARAGSIDVGDIELDTVDNIFNKGNGRETSENRDPVKKTLTPKTKKKEREKGQEPPPADYNPLSDPNLKDPSSQQAVDLGAVDKLGTEFQSKQGKSSKTDQRTPQTPIAQPGSYTDRGKAQDGTGSSGASSPYDSPYEYPPYSGGAVPQPAGSGYGNPSADCDPYQKQAAYQAGVRCGLKAKQNRGRMTRDCSAAFRTYSSIDRSSGWGACLSGSFDWGYRDGLGQTSPSSGQGQAATPSSKPASTPATTPAASSVVTAELVNRAGDNVHIFVEGQDNFGPQNKLGPGQKRTITLKASPRGGSIGFVAGRNGQILSQCTWTYTSSGRTAQVIFTGPSSLTCGTK